MNATSGDLRPAAQNLDLNIEQRIEQQSSHAQESDAHDEKVQSTGPVDEHSSSKSSSSSSSIGAYLKKEQSGACVVNVGNTATENEKHVGEKYRESPSSQSALDPYAHLDENEKRIVQRQLDQQPAKVNYFTLYRYATRTDRIIIAISALAAIIGGAALPLMTIVFASMSTLFQNFFLGAITQADFNHQLSYYTLYFVYLAIAVYICTYICTVGFMYTGEHITQKIREQYLAAVLRQNIAFFDDIGAGEVTTRITADTNLIQTGMSEKVSLTITAISTFITAFIVAFIKYWKLTLILSSTVFAILFLMGGGSRFIVKYNKKSLEAYARGGTVAEEVISSIRNATAFNTQSKLARQYDEHLCEAERWGYRQKAVLASMIGGMLGIIYLNYGLSFWQGSRYLVAGEMSLSDVLTIMLSIMIGAFSLSNVAPNAQAFTTSVAAAAKIFSTIDRVSPLDPMSNAGDKLASVEGTVELENIKHIYPSRPDVVVMENVNLKIPAGTTTALVGASGSGKSTIVGLVERFYDPVAGSVYLDGRDISTLNLRWLRQQISLVSQEPTLFSTTIFGNIAHGLIGTRFENATEQEKIKMVEHAAQMANAHDFVTALPEGYQTNVGERGFLLSGGQKQRIAIARAVVSDPKILLLDEATSALDTKSEGVVQAALDVAAQGRTTIVIAHRLSTIKTADNIVVMSRGNIVEQGTHNELVKRQGAYANLVEAQQLMAAKDDAADNDSHGEESDQIALDAKASPNDLLRLQTTKTNNSVYARHDGNEAKPKYRLWTLIGFIASFNLPEIKLMLLGLLVSIIAGGAQPTQSVFFGKSIVALSLPPSRYDETRQQAHFWSLMYLMLAIVTFGAYTIQGLAFAVCSERLIHRARDRAFRAMLRQDISWFDREENTAGALTSFLSTETTNLAGISGATLGTLLVVTTTLIAAISLSLAIGWKLALVSFATIPTLLACGYLRFAMLAKFSARAKVAYENSASFACESTSAVRTVASLTREQDVWNLYHERLAAQCKSSLRSILRSSTLYAASQSLVFLCNGLVLWYGGRLMSSGEYDEIQFFIIFSAIIFGTQSAGTVFSFAPDMGKASQAATELKILFDRRPEIDSWSSEGKELKTVTEGTIEFRNVHFRYPTRLEQPVLHGLNLTAKAGQYVALVGASGCGKSTTIALLERFYNPSSGSIHIDGHDISTINVNDYRSHLALVSQEPTLYQGTIKDNVLLGADREDVPEDEIITACKNANIYDFILSLPEGFSTVVGSKGSMLSGGQKQRIAIARALLRDPRILLLDEATSALDSESEKVVQAALDAAARGRTTIAVAHRLSTIQRADVIYVFDAGRVVERGTHHELLRAKGKYYELVNLQSLGKTE